MMLKFNSVVISLLLLISGWAQAAQTDPALLAHLYRRAAFSLSLDKAQQLSQQSYQQNVEALLNPDYPLTQVEPPDWVKQPWRFIKWKKLSREEKKQRRMERKDQGNQLKAWWLEQMVETNAPLVEVMTLFWHNHFTSSLKKVRQPVFLYRQNQLFRDNALGNVKTLLKQVLKDPAMLVYLDNHKNRKGKPNENLARELLELFTLGEGNYSEADIKQVARVLAGHTVDMKKGQYTFRKKWADPGDKVIFNQKNDFEVDDLVELIVQQSAFARHISGKIYRYFMGTDANEQQLQHYADLFKRHRFEMVPLIRAILLSDDFKKPHNRGNDIKSPAELLVGILRMFNVQSYDADRLIRQSRNLGQDLFDPPNVKGWPGGNSWISSQTLLARQTLLRRLLSFKEMAKNTKKSKSMMAMQMDSMDLPQLNKQQLQALILALEPIEADENDDHSQQVLSWLLDPVFQLR